jgi:hypothetical protein
VIKNLKPNLTGEQAALEMHKILRKFDKNRFSQMDKSNQIKAVQEYLGEHTQINPSKFASKDKIQSQLVKQAIESVSQTDLVLKSSPQYKNEFSTNLPNFGQPKIANKKSEPPRPRRSFLRDLFNRQQMN